MKEIKEIFTDEQIQIISEIVNDDIDNGTKFFKLNKKLRHFKYKKFHVEDIRMSTCNNRLRIYGTENMIKIALNEKGVHSNRLEVGVNSKKLKGFVIEPFDISEDGIIALYEKAEPVFSVDLNHSDGDFIDYSRFGLNPDDTVVILN